MMCGNNDINDGNLVFSVDFNMSKKEVDRIMEECRKKSLESKKKKGKRIPIIFSGK